MKGVAPGIASAGERWPRSPGDYHGDLRTEDIGREEEVGLGDRGIGGAGEGPELSGRGHWREWLGRPEVVG